MQGYGMVKSKAVNPVARYSANVIIAMDQLGNALWGGSPDETISSRLGRIERHYGGRQNIPWYRGGARVLNWALDKIQKDHCVRAVEEDEMQQIRQESVFDGGISRAINLQEDRGQA
jgi:hypothetical protein